MQCLTHVIPVQIGCDSIDVSTLRIHRKNWMWIAILQLVYFDIFAFFFRFRNVAFYSDEDSISIFLETFFFLHPKIKLASLIFKKVNWL